MLATVTVTTVAVFVMRVMTVLVTPSTFIVLHFVISPRHFTLIHLVLIQLMMMMVIMKLMMTCVSSVHCRLYFIHFTPGVMRL